MSPTPPPSCGKRGVQPPALHHAVWSLEPRGAAWRGVRLWPANGDRDATTRHLNYHSLCALAEALVVAPQAEQRHARRVQPRRLPPRRARVTRHKHSKEKIMYHTANAKTPCRLAFQGTASARDALQICIGLQSHNEVWGAASIRSPAGLPVFCACSALALACPAPLLRALRALWPSPQPSRRNQSAGPAESGKSGQVPRAKVRARAVD